MFIFFYNILYILFVLFYLPVFLLRRKGHPGILMRLGFFPDKVIERLRGQKVFWVHTVSVGEAHAASCFIKVLKERYPGHRLVISTVTKTGNIVACNLAGKEDVVIYSPLDISFIVRRVIELVNPLLLIVAETEIWPNLIINLSKRNIPVVVVNGRISAGSFKGYKLFRAFMKSILEKVSLFCMQTENDAQKIIELGAERGRVKITGNMKFDVQSVDVAPQNIDLGLTKEERLFIAGSTHRGEERLILKVYKELVNDYPDLRLLIAPRHIERAPEIEQLIVEFGFAPCRFSQSAVRKPQTAQRIFILDTIGQLKTLYAHAEIVYIGGSLVPHGGQNPIEAAVFAKPILFGPYMFNFSAIAGEFLRQKAAIMVNNEEQLKEAWQKILRDGQLRKELGENAQQLIQQNQGATLRNINFIKEIINI
ncbi:MAG: 3-deoxy-D-manno-octulosonic acid transferase [Candidatus Omnitrophota bacterium]